MKRQTQQTSANRITQTACSWAGPNGEIMMAQGSPPQATTAKPPSKAETFVNTTRSLVRPFLAVSFTGAAIALTFKGLLPAAVIGTAATAISSFYFGERSVRKGIPPLNSRGFNNPDASQGETDRST